MKQETRKPGGKIPGFLASCFKPARGRAGFTLVELLIAVGASGIVLGALAVATTSLAKSFDAMETYSRSQAASVRVMDAIAMDLRRASGVAITTSSTSNPNAASDTTAKYLYSASNAAANVKTITDGTFDPVNNRPGGRTNASTYLTLTLPGYYQTNNPTTAAYRSRTNPHRGRWRRALRHFRRRRRGCDGAVPQSLPPELRLGVHHPARGRHRPRDAERVEYLDITLTAQTGNAFLLQTSYTPTFSSARRNSTHRVAASDRVMLRNPRRD